MALASYPGVTRCGPFFNLIGTAFPVFLYLPPCSLISSLGKYSLKEFGLGWVNDFFYSWIFVLFQRGRPISTDLITLFCLIFN